jgi:NADH-quinone oxidoreductase subunit F
MVISACQHACPAGIDVPNYVAAVAAGRYAQAVEIIRERNPFPAVCGRICVHPCEFKCRRGELDDPVAIRALKRFAADWYYRHLEKAPDPFPVTRGERVAVVGAGPAGLTCAYYLAQMGYSVRVFEAQSRGGGGMLGLTVPEFRLPREVIEAEIAYIQSWGVDIRYDTPIDAAHTVNDLLEEGFGAVFIAAGAQASRRIGIQGEAEGIEGLHYGLQFLTDVREGKSIRLSGTVLVLGGGNVAVDTARTALRLGAESVHVYYRRAVAEMPAWKKDIEEALEEGVEIHPFWAPREIHHREGRVTGMTFAASCTVYDDGEACLTVNEAETRTVEANTVIISVGQAPDVAFLSRDSRLERALWGSLAVDENTLSTNIPGIFAGRDFTTGPSTVIQAIASGRRAALAIDGYLRGRKGRLTILDEKTPMEVSDRLALADETPGEKPRAKVKMEAAAERMRDFREVEKGLDEAQARYEARRCLRCDLESQMEGETG